MTVKYPDVMVRLVGEDSNSFFIIGRVLKALKRAGVPSEEVKAFQDDATSGDFNHVLRTVQSWVTAF